jgi:hypothetical protein
MNISQVEHENDVSGILDDTIFTHDVILPDTIEQKLDYLQGLKSDDEKNQLLLRKLSSLSLCVFSITPALILTLLNHFISVPAFLLILSYITAGTLGFAFIFMIFDPEFEQDKESAFPKFKWIKSWMMKKSIFKKRDQQYLSYSQKLDNFFNDYLDTIALKIKSYQEMRDSLDNDVQSSSREAFITGFNDLKKSFNDFKNNPFFSNGDIVTNKKNLILTIEHMENLIKYQNILLSQLQDSQKNLNLTTLL